MSICVEQLINSEANKRYDDKLFWYASDIRVENDNIIINIDNSNLVGNEKVAKELNIYSINDLRKGINKTKKMLVSSGALLWINHKFIITQRTSDAKYDPGKWTSPSGRCDRTPFVTALKELIEEIQILSNIKKIPFIPFEARELWHGKEANYYKADISYNEKYKIPMSNVQTFLNGDLIDECMMFSYFDRESNTLELRLPISANITEEFVLINPEYYTDVIQIELEDLNKYDIVNVLMELLRYAEVK